MTEETIFSKIIRKEIPAEVVYEDDMVLAFRDINPQRPVHVLIIPKQAIATLNDVGEAQQEIVGRLLVAAPKIATQLGIAEDGYRVLMNCGQHGRQEVMHIHLHLIGGADCGQMVSPL